MKVARVTPERIVVELEPNDVGEVKRVELWYDARFGILIDAEEDDGTGHPVTHAHRPTGYECDAY